MREDLGAHQAGDEDILEEKNEMIKNKKVDTEQSVESQSEVEKAMMEEDVGERMDRDFQLASDFKDELIPMGYEYYLNVVEHGEIEDSDSED